MSEGRVKFANVGGPKAPAPAANRPQPRPAPRGEVVAGKQMFYPEWKPEGSLMSSALKFIYQFSLFGFILFLILVFIHFTIYPIFSFSPNDEGVISIPTASDKQTSFTTGPAASDVSASIVSLAPCGYTLSFDAYQVGNFQATTFPRVLLYRSPRPVDMTSTDTSGAIVTKFPDTNLVVWLDPVKNDLYATAVTQQGTDPKRAETIAAVSNVPVREVFRTTIVFTTEFIEVYINGGLQQSLPFKGSPVNVIAGSYFYPVVRQASSNVMLANLFFWDRPLTAAEVLANGKPTVDRTFFTKPVKK